MSTHPVENPRAETRSARARREANGPHFPAALHEAGTTPVRRGHVGAALRGDQRRAGPARLRAARDRGAEHVEPDRDEHRRVEVLPGPDRLAGPRGQRARPHLACRRHDPELGRGAGLLRERRGPAGLLRRADAPARPPEGGLQQPGVVQRRDREAPAVVGVLHQLRAGHDGVDPRPRPHRGDALQVRLGHGLEPLRASARRRSRSPAAAPRRARSRSCAATTRSPA